MSGTDCSKNFETTKSAPCSQPGSPKSAPNPADKTTGLCCSSQERQNCSDFLKSESAYPDPSRYRFVDGFIDTAAGRIPRIRTALRGLDHLQAIGVRIGLGRDNYKIAPGLYATGSPQEGSPVLVTANYKLSFDTLRRELTGIDAWILVLETYGVNVWCAASKRTFSSQEVIRQVRMSGLPKLVKRRRLILPQLSATGVSAREVKGGCDFRVIWGPVHAKDLREFLANRMKASPAMRQVTFSLGERLVLIPVELRQLVVPSFWILFLIFILSGIGFGSFSAIAAWNRGLLMGIAYLAGILAGAVITPLALPWIPGKAFALKGSITGLLFGFLVILGYPEQLSIIESTSVVFFTIVISSYLAMNFTGSTPFTSPSGVEKEMRRALPLQVSAVVLVASTWVGSAIIG